MDDIWAELQRSPPERVTLDGAVLQRGSRVRLRPRPRGDIFDQVLTGRVAVVEGFDEGLGGEQQVAVTIEDDPGRDLGEGRFPGHRFFFSMTEVELLDEQASVDAALVRVPRVLVAGIGNVFLGDDGFGVAVARRLAERPLPAGVDVRDFGIRGMDLAYAMQNDYDAVVFVDAAPRGETPGTLSVIDARIDADGPVAVDTHGMDPVKVLALARALGRVPSRVLVVACEPSRVLAGDSYDEMDMTLSPDVERAVGEAVPLVESLIGRVVNELHTAT